MNAAPQNNEPEQRSRRSRLMLGCLLFAAALVSLGSVALAWRYARPAENGAVDADVAADATQQSAGSLPGRIAYIDDRGQLGTIDPLGRHNRLLTDDQRIFLFPAWSPDGSRIAAIGTGQDGAGVFTFEDREDAEGKELYSDTNRAPIYLYWSPDGERLSFIAQQEEQLGLFLAPAEEGNDSRLLTQGQPLYWAWSSEGERVLVHSGSAGPRARLAFVEVTGDDDEGENLAVPGFFQAPSFSQTGSHIAYAEVDEAGERWLVIEETNSGQKQRTSHVGAVALAWSPAREELAFISPDPSGDEVQFDFYGPLRLFDAASGEVRVLSDEDVIAFFWSPDGEIIAYLTVARGGGQQVAGVGGSRLLPVGMPEGQARQEGLHFSLWLTEVSSGQVRRVLDFRPGELFVTQFLPFFDQYGLSHDIWSPDSAALVLPIAEGGQPHIYVIPRNGDRIRPIAAGQLAFWSPR